MRVFISADFTGHWPVGSAAVVIAESAEQARALLTEELRQHGLKFDGTLDEVKADEPKAIVMRDGDY